MEDGIEVRTDKQQYLDMFVELMVKMIREDDELDISKEDFLSTLALQEMGSKATDISKKSYATDVEPKLKRYFKELCDIVSQVIDYEYHYTSYRWYKDSKRQKKIQLATPEGTLKYVVLFGNGRQKPAAGVRFVTKPNDPMFTVALSTDVDVTNKSSETREDNLKKKLNSGLIEPSVQKEKLESLQ